MAADKSAVVKQTSRQTPALLQGEPAIPTARLPPRRIEMDQPRPRDIDYAANAVRNALEEKFGCKVSKDLQVAAHERTISVIDGPHEIEGTRDDLLAAVRKAESYSDVWRLFPSKGANWRPV
jgi:hypothetical protein